MSDLSGTLTVSAALLAGIAGSAHCVVMCGALAGALSMRQGPSTSVLYHVGRLGGYSLAGALFGFFGATLQAAINLPLLATAARLAAGLLVVLAGIRVLFGVNPLASIERLGARFWKLVQPIAKQASKGQSPGRRLLIGLLWGWLPCGLVYSTLLLAGLSGSALRGAGVMLAFGLGTLPAMLATSLVGARVSLWLDAHGRRKWSGALLLAFGVWLAWVALPGSRGEHQGHAHLSSALRD